MPGSFCAPRETFSQRPSGMEAETLASLPQVGLNSKENSHSRAPLQDQAKTWPKIPPCPTSSPTILPPTPHPWEPILKNNFMFLSWISPPQTVRYPFSSAPCFSWLRKRSNERVYVTTFHNCRVAPCDYPSVLVFFCPPPSMLICQDEIIILVAGHRVVFQEEIVLIWEKILRGQRRH